MTTRSCFYQMQRRGALFGMVAALVFASSALAQSTASASGNAVPQPGGYSTWDISYFGGYQWFQFAQNGDIRPLDFQSGGILGERVTEDFTRYLGLEEGFSVGFNQAKLLPAGASLNNRAGVKTHNYEASIVGVFHFAPRESKVRPFIVLGPEAVWYVPSSLPRGAAGTFVQPANQLKINTEPALAYGLGVKYNPTRVVGFRLDLRGLWSFQPHFGLPSAPSGPGVLFIPPRGTASNLALEGGIVIRLGYHEPPPPPAPTPPPPPPPAPTANLQISGVTGATDVCPGDNLTLRVTASGYLPDQTPTYQWYVNGQPVSGATGASFVVPTANGSGSQAIRVTVSAGGNTQTSATVNLRIKNLAPPTLQFSVSPTTIPYGATATLSGNATPSECGGPATIRYTASEGSISGNTFNSSGVSFDMSNRLRQQSKVVRLTATATDTKNQTATATADVTVTLTPEARRLDDIVFQSRSARVNNCGKRLLLEELTPLLRADPGARVVLIGHRDNNESAASRVDERRVLNAAAILSAGKGICPQLDLSRIFVNWVGTDQTDPTRPALCGSSTNVRERSGQAVRESDARAQYRRVEIWIVPSGADMPPGTSGFRTAPERETKALGCPR